MEIVDGRVIADVPKTGFQMESAAKDVDFMRLYQYDDNNNDTASMMCKKSLSKLLGGVMDMVDKYSKLEVMSTELTMYRKAVLTYSGDTIINIPANLLTVDTVGIVEKVCEYVQDKLDTIFNSAEIPSDTVSSFTLLNDILPGIDNTSAEAAIKYIYGDITAVSLANIGDRNKLYSSAMTDAGSIATKLTSLANCINVKHLELSSSDYLNNPVSKAPEMVSYQLSVIRSLMTVMCAIINAVFIRQKMVIAMVTMMKRSKK